MSDFLEKKGFSKKEIEKVGLVAQNYQGKVVDKFRDRIIFPIRNINGKVVAFGGRIFKEPKNPQRRHDATRFSRKRLGIITTHLVCAFQFKSAHVQNGFSYFLPF